MIDSLKKIVLVLILLAIPSYLVFRVFKAITQTAEESNPYPTDPRETTAQFFRSLEDEYKKGPQGEAAYHGCYNLLTGQRKAATIIGSNNREIYALHFDRIRNYLVKRIGEDFVSRMNIVGQDPYCRASFDDYITLTIELAATKGLDNKSHYAIKQICDFPLDVMPGLGLESYQRKVDQAIESIDSLDSEMAEVEDAADVIKPLPGETSGQHLQRLIDGYARARQLDVRHDLLDYMVENFPREQIPSKFLQDIARDEEQAVHLRKIAEQILEK